MAAASPKERDVVMMNLLDLTTANVSGRYKNLPFFPMSSRTYNLLDNGVQSRLDSYNIAGCSKSIPPLFRFGVVISIAR